MFSELKIVLEIIGRLPLISLTFADALPKSSLLIVVLTVLEFIERCANLHFSAGNIFYFFTLADFRGCTTKNLGVNYNNLLYNLVKAKQNWNINSFKDPFS